MDFHLSVMQSYVLKLQCYYKSIPTHWSFVLSFGMFLSNAAMDDLKPVTHLFVLLIDNISRPAPNITHLLLKFDLDTPVERTILQPKFYYSCMKVILDILEKLLKPDVNGLLHEFSFQVTCPIDEGTFLSADLHLLESIELKKRTKHIVEIIKQSLNT
ncbi:hypothetical protein KIW84_076852 [Lathyrus oleraceus]|uniref:Uncharacterized protein n=1 Tax=Pisum sativum TaxID=3888 RepID=A0A9D4VZB9_PEA|nr:hypothetical protein KIW84_076852 [Pisum sativum]